MKTLAFLKPGFSDAMTSVVEFVKFNQFTIDEFMVYQFTIQEADEFYKEHRSRDYHNRNIKYISSGPVLFFIIEGENVIAKWRDYLGPSDPTKARLTCPNSLRALYGIDLPRNVAHGSDSVNSAIREIEYINNLIGE